MQCNDLPVGTVMTVVTTMTRKRKSSSDLWFSFNCCSLVAPNAQILHMWMPSVSRTNINALHDFHHNDKPMMVMMSLVSNVWFSSEVVCYWHLVKSHLLILCSVWFITLLGILGTSGTLAAESTWVPNTAISHYYQCQHTHPHQSSLAPPLWLFHLLLPETINHKSSLWSIQYSDKGLYYISWRYAIPLPSLHSFTIISPAPFLLYWLFHLLPVETTCIQTMKVASSNFDLYNTVTSVYITLIEDVLFHHLSFMDLSRSN